HHAVDEGDLEQPRSLGARHEARLAHVAPHARPLRGEDAVVAVLRGPGGAMRIGLLVGREKSFPEALMEEVRGRHAGVTIELAQLSAPSAQEAVPYDVLVDRISHEVTCY